MQCKLTDPLRHALLAQTACDDEKLSEFLNCEIDFLWDIQDDACMCRLRYLYTLLGLIEAAQIFSRNKVDQMTRIAQSQSDERMVAFSVLRGESERDASGRECAWSAATSQQYFQRSSQDSAVAFSDLRSKDTNEVLASGFDRSCRHTTGFGFHMSRVETGHFGDHFSESATDAEHRSSTSGGTGPYFPTLGTRWIAGPLDAIIPDEQTGTVIGTRPGPLMGEPPQPQSNQDFCPTPTPQEPNPVCRLGQFPSMGEGYSGRTTVEINIVLFAIRISWAEGLNWRQYFHCQSSTTSNLSVTNGTSTDSVTGFTRADEKDNQVYSSEQTDIAHLVRKEGITTRRGVTNLDAEDVQRSRAQGIAHSESQRDKEATATRQERAEAETVRTGESHTRKTESATNDMVSVKYSHIGQHLSKLWDRIWKETLLLERQFAAVPQIAQMNCIKESSCRCIARVSWKDRSVRA